MEEKPDIRSNEEIVKENTINGAREVIKVVRGQGAGVDAVYHDPEYQRVEASLAIRSYWEDFTADEQAALLNILEGYREKVPVLMVIGNPHLDDKQRAVFISLLLREELLSADDMNAAGDAYKILSSYPKSLNGTQRTKLIDVIAEDAKNSKSTTWVGETFRTQKDLSEKQIDMLLDAVLVCAEDNPLNIQALTHVSELTPEQQERIADFIGAAPTQKRREELERYWNMATSWRTDKPSTRLN